MWEKPSLFAVDFAAGIYYYLAFLNQSNHRKMPNQKLNKIVEKVERGSIFYKLHSPPQKIIDNGSRWELCPPSHVIETGEKLVAMGYRHCPSHWEWVLLLTHHKGNPWVDKVIENFSSGGEVNQINPLQYIIPPVANIVREPNEWTNKGGVPEQISIYLESQVSRFQWTPSPAQLTKQLQLAFGLYGWLGADGLKAEIFGRI